MLREGARTDSLAINASPRRVPGRDREKASARAPNNGALIESADDLRRFGVDQARSVELLVRVVLVAPAVGEPLPEPGAGYLTAQVGLEAAVGVAGAGHHRGFYITQLHLHVRLERASDRCGKLHEPAASLSGLSAQPIEPPFCVALTKLRRDDGLIVEHFG
jgi:hypothetical protein